MLDVIVETTLDLLSVDEKIKLSHLEARIKTGLESYVDAGLALAEVKDLKLYRGKFATFEEYCEVVWGKSRHWAYQLIGASEVVAMLSAVADKPLPKTERQARSLTQLLSQPEKLKAAWSDAVESAPDGTPTQQEVERAVRKVLPKRAIVSQGDTPIVQGDRLPQYAGQSVTVLKVEGERVKVESETGTEFTVFRTELVAQPKQTREQLLEALLREVLMFSSVLSSGLVSRIESAVAA